MKLLRFRPLRREKRGPLEQRQEVVALRPTEDEVT